MDEKKFERGGRMGKGKRKEAARKAEAARVQAWKTDNAPASDGRGLADDDLIKVAKKKIEANPGDKDVTSKGEMRTRFMLDIVLVVVTVAAAAEGVNQTLGITEATSDVPFYGKVGAIMVFVGLAVLFGMRAREWKGKM